MANYSFLVVLFTNSIECVAVKKYLWFFANVFWLLSVIPVVGLAVLLLFASITINGKLFAISVLMIWIGYPFTKTHASKRYIPGRIMLVLGIALWGTVIVLAPSGKSAKSAKLQSIYSGSANYKQWSISSFVPEVDQLLCGVALIPMIDPYFGRNQASDLRTDIVGIYQALEQEPDFHEVGGVLGLCYKQMLSGRDRSGHRFEYIPENTNEPMPAILFLHGSLGNFKGYQWVWKSFADANSVAVISPSYGYGEWRTRRGLAEVKAALAACKQNSRIDPQRIYLAGLSNGGAGVTMALPHIDEDIAGVIYLSPVLEPIEAAKTDFQIAITDKPVILISGSKDKRIPQSILEESLVEVNKVTEVESHFMADEDHFLFFSKRDKTIDLLSKWFQTQHE